MYENELYHHGIKGMRWGVRRYQNYDGTYTQAGVKRYKRSEAAYDHAQQRYKDVKAGYKAGTKTKGDVVNARIARNSAKSQLKKDYKHLKQDKLGDQGKALYSNGVRITDNEQRRTAIATAATVAAYASNYALKNSGKSVVINNQYVPLSTFVPATIGVGAAAVDGILSAKNHYQNKRLRAYYGHTFNY